MGGNVIIDSIPADKIKVEDRESIMYHLRSLFWCISNQHNNLYSFPLWDHILDNDIYYSGSTKYLFDTSIPLSELLKYKPTIGDIDIKVDKNNRRSLSFVLNKNLHNVLSGFYLIGYKESVDQIITLWHNELFGNIQIDFEFVDFIELYPTIWSTFSKNSEWRDTEIGIKAVFHKLLLRAVTGKNIDELIFLNESGKKIKKEISSLYAFSVNKGLRYKFKTVEYEGKSILQKLYVKDSKYIRNINKILNILFDKPEHNYWNEDQIKLSYSFSGLIELIIKNCDRFEHINIYNSFLYSVIGDNAQQLCRDKDEDIRIKQVAINYLKTKLYI
ncbi:MAG: hypothetical protein PHC28_12290 [Flavobacterium sp.]|uniref:hypothetical protein n=1 Tax=Flavobacterium sp. TaxID=239 RepID=UPI0026040A6F|nr:hypothetical protein [Flavobacterium sp.]MDD5151233.1 hypothetical protein [Flavobacterium sp.]